MARSTMTWRSTRWARWLGWTALEMLGLGLWAIAVFWWAAQFGMPGGDGLLVPAYLVGFAALPFAIGVRFVEWSWVSGAVVANGLLHAIALLVFVAADSGPSASGSGQAALGFVFSFMVTLPVVLVAAVAGVWWGKHRKGGGLRSRVADPGGNAPKTNLEGIASRRNTLE